MKSWLPLIVFCVFASLNAVTKEEKTSRQPSNEFFAQVQLCEGTEAMGNEGQGMGVSAMINVYNDSATNQKKCDLGLAYAYEYGHDRGLKIGRHQSYNVTAVPMGKTECFVKEEGGQVLITLKKAVRPNSKRPAKVLVENCKVTDSGF